MLLCHVKKNSLITIVKISDPVIRSQAIRLGIYEGAKLTVSETVEGGPVLLRSHFQDMAVGSEIANHIEVSVQRKVAAK